MHKHSYAAPERCYVLVLQFINWHILRRGKDPSSVNPAGRAAVALALRDSSSQGHINNTQPTSPHKEQYNSSCSRGWVPPNRATAYHVEGTLVVVLLHKLDIGLVLPQMLAEHHILHSTFIIRHVSPPQSVLPLLQMQS